VVSLGRFVWIPTVGICAVCGWIQPEAHRAEAQVETAPDIGAWSTSATEPTTLECPTDSCVNSFGCRHNRDEWRKGVKGGAWVEAPIYRMPMLVPDTSRYAMPIRRPSGQYQMPLVDPYAVPDSFGSPSAGPLRLKLPSQAGKANP
jgi:hypothetical protein